MDRERLAVLAQTWEPTARFSREDINALMEMLDARDTRIAELEQAVVRAAAAEVKLENLRRAATVVASLAAEISQYLPQ